MDQERTVIFAPGTDRRLTRPFAMTPEVVLTDGSISLGARVLYGVLMLYAWQDGQCSPTQATIAQRLSCSERQVRTFIRELSDRGYVRVHQRGLNRPNVYEMIVMADDPDRKAPSGPTSPERKHTAGPDRQYASDKVDSGTETYASSSLPRKKSLSRPVGETAHDDDDPPSASPDPEVEALCNAVRAVAPAAVPDRIQARAFIEAHCGLGPAKAAIKAAADKHARTRRDDPIVSWQWFLAVTERSTARRQPSVVRSPCDACGGSGLVEGGLCPSCNGARLRFEESVGDGTREIRHKPSAPGVPSGQARPMPGWVRSQLKATPPPADLSAPKASVPPPDATSDHAPAATSRTPLPIQHLPVTGTSGRFGRAG